MDYCSGLLATFRRKIGVGNRCPRILRNSDFCRAVRKREQKKRWFRDGQKWRTGCEGRVSVVKRRHGLNRCRYKGHVGMERWVGLGVIADNLINIGRMLEEAAEP
jgi:hypothetical protein